MRRGSANSAIIGLVLMLTILLTLGWLLARLDEPASMLEQTSGGCMVHDSLFVYCAAGTRPAIQEIVDQYADEFGVEVEIQYQGSNTLLSQIEVSRTGDVYIAADESYIRLGRQRGLIQEAMTIARQTPVIAVRQGNPRGIRSIADLLRDDVDTALGSPDQAAVGRVTRKLLQASGHWKLLEPRVAVFKPTVPEVANDVLLGTVDAAIVWDATLVNYPGLEAVHVPELEQGTAAISVGVLSSATSPPRALHFARYLSAPEKGQRVLKRRGFQTAPGDAWADAPQLTFFCGAVNRAAVQPVIEAFEKREGAVVNVMYNGCGFLTGTMRTIADQNPKLGFPDTYMACDVYYLDVVSDWFQDAVNVSDTRLVIVVPKGNPQNIATLHDLTRPGLRIAVGQPRQCTIGVLTRRLFEAEGIADAVAANIVAEKVSSAQLVPDVATGSVDAVVAYATDAQAAADRVDTIAIDAETAVAIQPFSIARSSHNKLLAKRLFETLARSRESFERAGFHWRLPATEGAAP